MNTIEDARIEARKTLGTIYILQGAPGCGKSTWIKDNGLERFTVSPDAIRTAINLDPLVFDGEHVRNGYDFSPETSAIAFDIARRIVGSRMRRGQTIIFDSTGARRKTMNGILQEAMLWSYRVVWVDMQADVSIDTVIKRNASRGIRTVPEDIVRKSYENVANFEILKYEFKETPEQVIDDEFVPIVNADQWKHVRIIGDVQGCWNAIERSGVTKPDADTLYVFAGDLFDRGPDNDKVFDWAVMHANDDNIVFVLGNHDAYTRYYGRIAQKDNLTRSTKQTVEQIMDKSVVAGHSDKRMRSAAKDLYESFTKVFAFRYHGQEYMVTHGGIDPEVFTDAYNAEKDAYAIGFMSQQDYYYGTGTTVNTGDYSTDIDRIIHDRQSEVIQFHGHRNEHHIAADAYDDVFNLEDSVEREGYLRVASIHDDGITVDKYTD